MQPRDQDLGSLDANGKAWVMERPPLSTLIDGNTWSFVDECHAGITNELLKVIFFFEIANGMSNHFYWNGFTVGTNDISGCNQSTFLQPSYAPNGKDINGVKLSQYKESDHHPTFRGSGRGVDTAKLLSASELSASGTVYTPLQPFRISLSFTAAVFEADRVRRRTRRPEEAEEEAEAEPRQAIFGVVTITTLRNVDSLRLILERFLVAPPLRSANFEETNKRQRELMELLEHIIIYQASGVLGDESCQRPKDYFSNPTGRMGIDNVCHVLMEPIKMCKLIERNYNSPRRISIINYPNIDWQGDPDAPGNLKRYLSYISACLGHQIQARNRLTMACKESGKERPKGRRRKADDQEAEQEPEPPPTYDLLPAFGVPVEERRGWYCCFQRCLSPVHLRLRRLCDINVKESFQCWCLNLGALPPLALCLMRGSLLFDPSNPDTMRLDTILLRELDVPSDLATIRQRFYGVTAKPHAHIAMSGCQMGSYIEILKHIRTSVELGAMSAGSAVHLLRKAIEYGISVFKGMAEGNMFLSKRVAQVMDIMAKISLAERIGEVDFCRGMKIYQRSLLELPPISSRQDAVWRDARASPHFAAMLCPYDRARRTLLQSLVDVNRFYRLNSGNMQLMLEIMISMIAHTIGSHNTTHLAFGRGLEIAPACGTMREWVTSSNHSRLRVRKVDNPNSAGKDFTADKITELFTNFCQKYGVHDSVQGLMVIKRFTPVAMEGATTIQISKGQIVGTPDETLNMSFLVITESRGDAVSAQNTLIQSVYKRGGHQNDCSITTGEDSKDKTRHTVSKIEVSPVMLCTRCGNRKIDSVEADEQMDTIAAVLPLIESGSTVHVPGTSEGQFGDVQTSANEARSAPWEGDTERYAKEMLAGTHIHCTTWIGMPNFISTFPGEINAAVLSAVDWMLFFVQKHLNCMLHPKCQGNNWLRLRRVYESRAVAFTAWCKMTQYLTDCRDRETAIYRAACSFQCDALALTDVGGMVWSLLRRSLHWGPVLYTACFIRESGMPIVPVQVLVQLLGMEGSPPRDGPLKVWHSRIVNWLSDCVAQNRFCPADQTVYSGDFCEYVSSAGLSDGTIETPGVLRVASNSNLWKTQSDRHLAQAAMAKALWEIYGSELYHSCALSEDSMQCAIDDMLGEFAVEIQKLLGVNLFDMERHLRFFGLEGKLDFQCRGRNDKHPYMIKSVWQRDGREVCSIGAGIHVMQLLVLGSFVGDVEALHPKIINDLCCNLIRHILLYAPAGMVPGNFVELRSFDCYSGKLETLALDEAHATTESFLRPYDVSFAETGHISYCKNICGFAPEDVLHMGGMCEIARRVGCKVYDIPSNAEVTYYIRPKKAYCIRNPLTGGLGYLIFDGKSLTMDCMDSEEGGECYSLSILDWQEEMRAKGFIMLPMIWRSGACVAMNEGDIGCLVPPDEHEDISHDGNFCINGFEYRALIRYGLKEKLPVMRVLETLLAIGDRLYLKMESNSASSVRRRLPVDIHANDLAGNVLQVHLSAPNVLTPEPGKVFVVSLVRKMNGGVQSVKGSASEVLVVDPWELMMQPGERHVFKFMSG